MDSKALDRFRIPNLDLIRINPVTTHGISGQKPLLSLIESSSRDKEKDENDKEKEAKRNEGKRNEGKRGRTAVEPLIIPDSSSMESVANDSNSFNNNPNNSSRCNTPSSLSRNTKSGHSRGLASERGGMEKEKEEKEKEEEEEEEENSAFMDDCIERLIMTLDAGKGMAGIEKENEKEKEKEKEKIFLENLETSVSTRHTSANNNNNNNNNMYSNPCHNEKDIVISSIHSQQQYRRKHQHQQQHRLRHFPAWLSVLNDRVLFSTNEANGRDDLSNGQPSTDAAASEESLVVESDATDSTLAQENYEEAVAMLGALQRAIKTALASAELIVRSWEDELMREGLIGAGKDEGMEEEEEEEEEEEKELSLGHFNNENKKKKKKKNSNNNHNNNQNNNQNNNNNRQPTTKGALCPSNILSKRDLVVADEKRRDPDSIRSTSSARAQDRAAALRSHPSTCTDGTANASHAVRAIRPRMRSGV
eukprot:CAMPEP_0175057120 /NCGR_PEP_ID=MMETSP0052_2-20121109/11080_1 /TAXON_ID=51329 ORGANISM="Polytomella parva, Strain SAG 63-3" /NCGR_SAMPLE_ID=MMETSP0052_2 /ASSEMBLY_ACC=CAM_ASM_000194 /LENGTH=476 /DNA_ID=CAMNT_0016322283 /DNA_START=35 /DNA_END=1462 /DNA_ORIENTATION=-